ncbi:MAG: hypothetical protein MRY83_19210, partial [Flavobacteriales bacterium]|nr:hypothetical protein [Flavobacteriales bacterium]
PNFKTTSEFISIAYSDLFGTTIDDQKLTDLSLALVAFGDKKLIEDMIIKNFLNEPGSNIPSVQDMQGDIPKFIQETYRKFYNRDPNEFETWQIEKAINEDSNLTPELIYYAFLTSNEYRYY